MYHLSVYRTLFTNYLICSSFVSIGVLDLLMGIEQVNDLFGGPRLPTGSAGANPGLLMLTSREISLKLSSLPGFLSVPHSPILSYPKVYSEISLRDLEEEGFRLISEPLADGGFLQVVLALASNLSHEFIEDPWIPLLLSWLKRDFALL